jgi:hypothetical protein
MNCKYRNIWLNAIDVAYHSDLHGVRLILAIAELIWSITLFFPGNTFDRPTYDIMSTIMPENTWAFLFGIMGITQFSILATRNYHERFPVWFAAINQTVWWFVVISMYMSVFPPPAAISGELALAIGASWVWVRSGKSNCFCGELR